MRITIQHFKCYDELVTYNFPTFKTTIICGSSGKGKSTIFDAILWCLYGNMTGIKPHKYTKDKITGVILQFEELNNISIRRCVPNNLDIQLSNEQILSADGAQGYINNIFGHKHLWVSSSYSIQGNRNLILTLSNAEKFQLLHELTYGYEAEKEENTPEHFLEKCDIAIDDLKSKIILYQGKFIALRDAFQRKMALHDKSIKMWPSNGNVNTYIDERNKLQVMVASMKKELISIKDIESRRDILMGMIKQLNSVEIPYSSSEVRVELDKLEKEHHQYEDNKIKWETYLLLNRKKKDLGSIPSDYKHKIDILNRELAVIREYKAKGITDVKTERDKLEKQLQSYEKDIILDKEWKNYQFLIGEYKEKYNQYIKSKNEHDAYLLKVSGLRKMLNTDQYIKNHMWWKDTFPSLEFTIENINAKISDYTLIYLSCPHCGKNVTYENKCLYAVHTPSIDVNKLKDILKFEIEYNNIQMQLSLIKEPTIIPEPNNFTLIEPSRPQGIKDPRQQLEQLKSLPDPPAQTEEFILKELSFLQNGYEMDKITAQLQILGAVEEPKESIYDILVQKRSQYEYALKNENLIKRRNELISTCPSLPEINSDLLTKNIETIENNINIYSQYIQIGHLMNELYEDQRCLQSLEKEMLSYSNEENTLNMLRLLINEISTSSLEDTVKAINASTNSILKEIFEDPITIVISTHKQLKTRDKIKLEVNIKVYYKDGSYDGISKLSFGESDRISLALTIAISKLSTSPILLLDETMAYLNDNLIEKCIEMIKLHLPNKTILNIDHESVVGRFEHSIEL